MKRLVGIPWGHKAPPKEADCVSLMLYAQRILWGRDINLTHIDMRWTQDALLDASEKIRNIVPVFCTQIENPEVGGIATVDTLGHTHIITIIEKDKLLDIVINLFFRYFNSFYDSVPTRYADIFALRRRENMPQAFT